MWQVHELQFGGSVPKDDTQTRTNALFVCIGGAKSATLGTIISFF